MLVFTASVRKEAQASKSLQHAITHLQGRGEEIAQPEPSTPLLELARPDKHGQWGIRFHFGQALYAFWPTRHVFVEHLPLVPK